jgi:hypothetical protein
MLPQSLGKYHFAALGQMRSEGSRLGKIGIGPGEARKTRRELSMVPMPVRAGWTRVKVIPGPSRTHGNEDDRNGPFDSPFALRGHFSITTRISLAVLSWIRRASSVDKQSPGWQPMFSLLRGLESQTAK